MWDHTSLNTLIQSLLSHISVACVLCDTPWVSYSQTSSWVYFHNTLASGQKNSVDLVLKKVQVPLSALIKPVHKTTDWLFSFYVSLTSILPTSMCSKQNRAFFMSQNWYKILSILPDEWKLGHNVTASTKAGLDICSWYGHICATRWNEQEMQWFLVRDQTKLTMKITLMMMTTTMRAKHTEMRGSVSLMEKTFWSTW